MRRALFCVSFFSALLVFSVLFLFLYKLKIVLSAFISFALHIRRPNIFIITRTEWELSSWLFFLLWLRSTQFLNCHQISARHLYCSMSIFSRGKLFVWIFRQMHSNFRLMKNDVKIFSHVLEKFSHFFLRQPLGLSTVGGRSIEKNNKWEKKVNKKLKKGYSRPETELSLQLKIFHWNVVKRLLSNSIIVLTFKKL